MEKKIEFGCMNKIRTAWLIPTRVIDAGFSFPGLYILQGEALWDGPIWLFWDADQ